MKIFQSFPFLAVRLLLFMDPMNQTEHILIESHNTKIELTILIIISKEVSEGAN